MVKFWTLMSGTSYIASISNPSFTHNPMLAVKYGDIKTADAAANHWKRKHGLPVMVHVEELDSNQERSWLIKSDYSENL